MARVGRNKIIQQLRRYAVYRRALLSFLALSAITVFVVSTVLFVTYGRKSARDITASGTAILRQTARAIDLLNEQVRTIGTALIEEEAVVGSLRAVDVDRLREYRTNLVFGGLRSVYPFVRFFGLYNGATDRYVNTEGLVSDDEREFLVWISETVPSLFFSSFVRPVDYPYPRPTDSGRVVSFVIRPDLRLQRPNESFILVNVELEYVENLISNFSGAYTGNVLVVDEEGNVVIRGAVPGFIDPKAADRLISKSREAADDAPFQFRTDGTRYVVTQASATAVGWTLLGIRTRRSVLLHSLSMVWLTAGLAMLILFIGAGVSMAFTRRLYDPLSRLIREVGHSDLESALETVDGTRINEYEVLGRAYTRFADRIGLLEGALDSDLPPLRRTYVHSLLTGAPVELPDNPETARRILDDIAADEYMVVLCTIDRLSRLKRTLSAEGLSSLRLYVVRSCRDGLADTGVAVPVLLDSDEIAVLTGGSRLRSRDVVGRLREIQAEIGRQAGCTVSFALSSITDDPGGLYESLRDARRLSRYRFFAGPSSMITPADLVDTPTTFSAIPSSLSRRLIEAVRLRRENETAELLSEFRGSVRRSSYQGALALYHQLSMELLTAFDYLQDREAESFVSHRRFVEDMTTLEFSIDADAEIDALCRAIMDSQEAEGSDKSRLLFADAVSHIRSHFSEPNLSLESVAEDLKVSGGHLGRVFAAHSDRYLSDYISMVRIEYVKTLLLETSDPVQQIARKAGLTNPTYFFTLFKKHVGMTPARFRRSSDKG